MREQEHVRDEIENGRCHKWSSWLSAMRKARRRCGYGTDAKSMHIVSFLA